MKKHIRSFLLRGLCAAVFGPIVLAIVYFCLGQSGVTETLTVNEVSLGILSISLMAFVAAGVTEVYQIERLPVFTAALLHGAVLYLDYLLLYLLNGWLKQELTSFLVFTGIFVLGYALVWLVIYFSTRRKTIGLNKNMKKGC